jgi:hypothetical protein
MKSVTGRDWKREFARSAAYREEQIRFFKEVERRHKEERITDRIEDDMTDLARASVAMATDTQIAEFRVELDDYRAATVESLMEDEQRLAEIRERIEKELAQAYVLPDGRRVFKFRDGVRVIDEFG